MREHLNTLCNRRVLELFDQLPRGKGVRAKLIDIIAKESGFELAVIIEMIHLASLLHDDVIDSASSRRGRSTINSIYGDKTAIIFGDILYSKAFNELNKFDKRIVDLVSKSVVDLSIGELQDINLGFNCLDYNYIDMITDKTASLIKATCASAGILVGLDETKLAKYGKNLGLVFQIIDDILDITSTEDILGKPVMSDFKEGKMTLPYIYLYYFTDNQHRLKVLFNQDIDEEDQEWLYSSLKKYKLIEKTKAYADKLAKDGIEALDGLPEDIQKELSDIMIRLVDREF